MSLFQDTSSAWTDPVPDAHDVVVRQQIVGSAPADVALLGLPYDGAVIGRKGAREGPAAIRRALGKLKPQAPMRWLDLGDARMPEGPREASEVAREAMRAAVRTGAFPVALGGDHSLTYGLVRGVVDEVGPVAVVNLDAHLDVRVADPPNSGTSFRRLVDDKVVEPSQIVEAGIRPYANSVEYLDWAKRVGITVATVDTMDLLWDKMSLTRLPVYLSLDMDVLDETAAPGVSAPTPGGLTTTQLFAILRRLAPRLVAMDVVETSPPLDHDERTSRAAAWSVLHAVSARLGGPQRA